MTNQEIIDGLRDLAQNQKSLDCGDHDIFEYDHDVCMAAASAIERLEAEIASLREQLTEHEPIAMQRQEIEDVLIRYAVTVEDFLILAKFCTETALHNGTLEIWLQNAWEKWGRKHDSSHVTADHNSLHNQQKQPNEALTLDELRDMDGEPVWVQDLVIPRCSAWHFAMKHDNEIRLFDTVALGRRIVGYNATTGENYGKTWLAYRRRPERSDDNGKND